MEERRVDNLNLSTVSVTEAAQRLGVSERTVYRMLKSGKLQRVSMSDNIGKPPSVPTTGVLVDVENEKKIVNFNVSNVSDNLSDILTNEAIEALRQELQAKDRQIELLLERQKELTQTVQRLQEQMYELARLVLSQNTAGTKGTVVEPAPQDKGKRRKVGLLARLLGRSDNS